MSMTALGMSAAIKSAIQSIPGIVITDATTLQKFSDALAQALVIYIQANAQVSGTATGVQGGGGTAPVTGTVS
jgi:hypothetical protein